MKNCLIFDFDCTLTYTHWFYFVNDFNYWLQNFGFKNFKIDEKEIYILKNCSKFFLECRKKNPIYNTIINEKNFKKYKKCVLKYIFGGKKRLDMIIKLFKTINDKNYDIYVISYSYMYDIYLMFHIFDIGKIKKVIAKSRYSEMETKDYYLKEIYFSGVKKIIYVDDSEHDYDNFIKNLDEKDKNLVKNDKDFTNFIFIKLIKEDNGINNTIYKNILKYL